MNIRGVKVGHSTIQRRMFKYAPMIEASMHKRKNRVCTSWRMDETYIKVAGKEGCLYRAVDKFGETVDFLLTKRRIKGFAQKFFNKTILNNQNPRFINNDELVLISVLLEGLTEIISGIKTLKLDGVNTLIIVLNKTTET